MEIFDPQEYPYPESAKVSVAHLVNVYFTALQVDPILHIFSTFSFTQEALFFQHLPPSDFTQTSPTQSW